MSLISVRSKSGLGTLLVDKKKQKVYMTPEILKKSQAHYSMMWIIWVTGILVTPYWLAKMAERVGIKLLDLPRFEIDNPILWWIGVIFSFTLPIVLWWIGRQKQQLAKDQIQLSTLTTSQMDEMMKKWTLERIWVWIVLYLLPPTILMFLVLFVIKKEALDLLLLMLHLALFLRRLEPHAFSRLTLSEKQLITWEREQ